MTTLSERTEAEPIAAGSWSGGALRTTVIHSVTAAVLFVSPLMMLVPAAFLGAGLKLGVRGMVAAIVGASALIGMLLVMVSPEGFRAAELGRLFALGLQFGLPSLAAYHLIQRRFPLGWVIAAAVGVTALSFGAIELFLRAAAGYSVYGALVAEIQTAAAATLELQRTRGTTPEVLSAMESVSAAISGTFVPALMMITATFAFVASIFAISRFRSFRLDPSYLFRNLAFPEWMLILFVIGGISPLLTGALRAAGLNLLAVIAFCFLLQGLAVFRYSLLRWSLGPVGLVAVSVALVVLTLYGAAPFLLFLVGLFDPFFDFRKINRKEEFDESHTD
jgi:hypothetical protein